MVEKDPKGAYVRDVTERTRVYVRELQEENERLRSGLAVSEAERGRLTRELGDLRRQLEAPHHRLSLDDEQLTHLAEENRRFAERYVVLEQKNSHLANLYVASYRLHETLSQSEVVSIIQEIVINLIGCEHHAVFDLDPDGRTLHLLGGMGIGDGCARIKLGDDPVSSALRAGEIFVAQEEPLAVPGHPHPLTACVPLRLVGKTTGAIAVYRLLPQKPGIEGIDRELFELLAVHAGMALYCTKLHTSAGRR